MKKSLLNYYNKWLNHWSQNKGRWSDTLDDLARASSYAIHR